MYKRWLWFLFPLMRFFNDLPRRCAECNIETAEPVMCWWCSKELGGG